MQNFSPLRFIFKSLLVFLVFVSFSQTVFSQTNKEIENVWTLPYKQCWVLKEPVEIIASDNDYEIYLSFIDGKIRKIDSKTSDIIWETDLGNRINSEIFFNSANLLISTKNTRDNNRTTTNIKELSKMTGITNMQVNFNENDFTLLKDLGEQKLFIDQTKSELVFFDNKNNIIWKRSFKDLLLNQIIVNEKIISISTSSRVVFLIDLYNGENLFELNFPNEVSDFYLNDSKGAYAGDVLGNIYFFNFSKKKYKKVLRTGGKIFNISDYSDKILVTSGDNFVYSISKQKGNFLWKRRFPGKIETIPLINKEVAFIFSDSKVFLIELQKGRIINQFTNQSKENIIGKPILQNTALIVPYSKGLFKFDLKGC